MRTHVERIWTMVSPLRLNITTIVNSSATSVNGLIRGMNDFSYHARPFVSKHHERASACRR